MKRTPIVAAALSAGALTVLAAATVSAPPPPGPGGVVAAHERLVEALESRDRTALEGLVVRSGPGATTFGEGGWKKSSGPVFHLPDGGGGLLELRDRDRIVDALLAWQGSGEGPTRMLRVWTDCFAGRLGYAVAIFSRSSADGTTRTYVGTTLVEESGGHWRFFHLHLSPAGETDPALRNMIKARSSDDGRHGD